MLNVDIIFWRQELYFNRHGYHVTTRAKQMARTYENLCELSELKRHTFAVESTKVWRTSAMISGSIVRADAAVRARKRTAHIRLYK